MLNILKNELTLADLSIDEVVKFIDGKPKYGKKELLTDSVDLSNVDDDVDPEIETFMLRLKSVNEFRLKPRISATYIQQLKLKISTPRKPF